MVNHVMFDTKLRHILTFPRLDETVIVITVQCEPKVVKSILYKSFEIE